MWSFFFTHKISEDNLCPTDRPMQKSHLSQEAMIFFVTHKHRAYASALYIDHHRRHNESDYHQMGTLLLYHSLSQGGLQDLQTSSGTLITVPPPPPSESAPYTPQPPPKSSPGCPLSLLSSFHCTIIRHLPHFLVTTTFREVSFVMQYFVWTQLNDPKIGKDRYRVCQTKWQWKQKW